MSTPKGTRCVKVAINPHEAVHVYSNAGAITLQLRREIPTESDLSAPSFKVAVKLTPAAALKIAGELLTAAGMMAAK